MRARRVQISPEYARFELERREMEASLVRFARGAWHVVEPEREYCHNWHIDYVCTVLEGMAYHTIRNVALNLPPRHGKSMLVSVLFPAWVWTWAPSTRFVYASYAQSLADDHASLTRRLVQSEWYQYRWGHKVTIRAGRKTLRRFETTAGGFRQATSVGGTGTGKGGDYVWADDGHNVRERESDAKIAAVIDWWDHSMSTRGDDPATFCRGIVMQRVAEGDLTGHVIANDPDYVHVRLPARYEGERNVAVRYEGDRRIAVPMLGLVDPRRTIGEPLWVGRYDDAALTAIERSLGPYGTAAQLQQRPAPRGGGVFKRDKFKTYGRLVLERLLSDPKAVDEWLTVWDLKVKDGTAGKSFVVGEVWARRGANAFLIDQYRDKVGFTATCEAVRNMAANYPQAVPILVEAKANGPAVLDAMQHQIPGMMGIEPRGDKETRAHAVSPYVDAGNIWVPDEEIAPWIRDWYAEITLFPMALSDDQVDCLSMALDRFFLSGGGDPLIWVGSVMRTPQAKPAPGSEQAEILRMREVARVRRALETERRLHPERFRQEGEVVYTGEEYKAPYERE